MKIRFFTILLCVILLNPAQGATNEELLALSLDELLNVTVSATTKSEVAIQKAPGVVRVFTAKDIAKYHFTTLQEVLMQVPGMQINQYRAGHQLVWTRGVQGRYNNKTLLLIDDVPMRDSYYGNFNIDAMLPLHQVAKIEIINGPGSVLYGTNAFASVIKVTTKNHGRSLRAAYAEYETPGAALETDYRDTTYAYLDYYRSDGFSPTRNADASDWQHPQDSERAYFLFKHRMGAVRGIAAYTDYHYPERYKTDAKDYALNRRPKYLSLRYSREISEDGRFSAHAYLSHYTLEKERHNYRARGVLKSYDEEYLDTYLLGANFDYIFSTAGHTVTIGLSYQEDQGDDIKQRDLRPEAGDFEPNLLEGNIQRQTTGIFLQDVWALSETMSLTAGVRQEMLSDFDNELSYRLGITAQWDNGFYGKALYGTAFRTPSYREYLDILAYNPDLQPEHLKTFEIQAGYLFAKGDVNLSLFVNRYDDFIGELNVETIATPGGVRDVEDDEVAFNFAGKTITGLELYGVFQPWDALSLQLGAAYLLTAEEELGNIGSGVTTTYTINTGTTDITGLSDFTLNLAAAYRVNTRYTLGGRLFYSGHRKGYI